MIRQKKMRRTKKMNEHSEKFYLVKGYYDSGEWKKKAVKNAVKKNWITAAEYEEIVGEPYVG